MIHFPCQYHASATAKSEGEINLHSDGVADIVSAAPKNFGGPGDRWAPETLLVATLGDCFILTFRAVAAAMKINWVSVRCDVQGTLAQVGNTTKFTEFILRIQLQVPFGADERSINTVWQKTKAGCFVSNSLAAQITLDPVLIILPER